MTYTTEQLINSVCEKSFRSSKKNLEKLNHCGIPHGEPIPLFGSFTVTFFASHGGIRKVFRKGSREVTKATVLRNLEKAVEEDKRWRLDDNGLPTSDPICIDEIEQCDF